LYFDRRTVEHLNEQRKGYVQSVLFDLFKVGIGPSSSSYCWPYGGNAESICSPITRSDIIIESQLAWKGSIWFAWCYNRQKAHGTETVCIMGLEVSCQNHWPKRCEVSALKQIEALVAANHSLKKLLILDVADRHLFITVLKIVWIFFSCECDGLVAFDVNWSSYFIKRHFISVGGVLLSKKTNTGTWRLV